MLKQRIFAVVAVVALLIAAAGVSGVVGDSVGLSVTSPAYACPSGSGSGGGC